MNDQVLRDQDVAEVNYSFGQRLSSARRALNLTQEQVAADLRLKTDLIKALEEEDYSRLPTHMYIAGYLRNYARLLKIPVEPLLTALDKAKLESPPLINDVSRPRKASHSRLMVKLFVLVLFVVVIAGLVSWIQSQNLDLFLGKHVEQQQGQTEQQQPKALLAPLSEKPADEPLVNESRTLESEAIPDPVTEVIAEVIDEVAKVEDAVIEEVLTPEIVTEEVANAAAQAEPLKGGVELMLQFSDDCWAEVKDSRGVSLVYDLYRGGQSKQVKGIPPFDIFLGNAAVVTIEYNGQAYDASAHIRGKLARFHLGQAEDYKSTTE